MIKFKHLYSQIMVVFVSVMLAVLVLSGVATTILARQIVTDNILHGQRALAISLTDHILLELGSNFQALDELTSMSAVKSMAAAALVTELRVFQSRNPTITNLYIADRTGQQIARSDFDPTTSVASVSGFQEALQGRVYYSDLSPVVLSSQYQQSGNTSFTLGWQDSTAVGVLVPISNAGQVVGILGANINLFRIQPLIENLTFTHDETVMVLSRSGEVVAYSRRAESGKLPELGAPQLTEALKLGLSEVPGSYNDETGRTVKGVIQPIGKQGWNIVVQTPVTELAGETNRLRLLLVFVLAGSAAVTVAAAWLTARRLAQPIVQLAHAAEQVAAGNLTTRVETNAVNELGTLADSFNRMVSEISYEKARNKKLLNELKQAFDKMELATQGWRATLDSMKELVWICDKDCKLIRVNRAFADAAGIEPKQIVGKNCSDVLDWADETHLCCPSIHTIQTKESGTTRVFSPKQEAHFEVSTSPVFNNKGEAVASVCVARKIVEQSHPG